MPPNPDTIPAPDKECLTRGNRFAAQRGILRDEISALFKSMGRDYMAGLKELIMQLYDCPPYLDSNTNNRGMVVIHDTALSILGAATPAELACAISVNDWYNGNLAHFALLTPEPDYAERPAPRKASHPTILSRACGGSTNDCRCPPRKAMGRPSWKPGRWCPMSGNRAGLTNRPCVT